MKIPVLPFGTEHTLLTPYRYTGESGCGTVVRLFARVGHEFSDCYAMFPDGELLQSPLQLHFDWRDFVRKHKLEGDCFFPDMENGPCHFCKKASLGVFAIDGAPISLPLCEEHIGAYWDHETEQVRFKPQPANQKSP